MNLGTFGHFAQVVLHLAAQDQVPPSPQEVVQWSNEEILYDKIIERATAAGVDPSAFSFLMDKQTFTNQMEGWGNAIDPQRSYGLSWDGNGGWLALLWSYVDLVNAYAAKVEVP